ncbi:MAG: GMC family oxidoreductase [Hyphomonadaceae bacterium]
MTRQTSIETPARSYDAIVIGSGPGGSTVALRLTQAGKRVLLVERGGWYVSRPGVENDYLYDVLGMSDPISFVGGKSKFYGAALYRFRESDFREVQFETGTSPAWPFTYEELEPYYCEAEALYRVHGSPDGDPTEPRRSAPYPHAPVPHDPALAKVMAKLNANGIPTAVVPRGIDQGPGRPCVMCAACDAYVCRRDAKMDAEIAAVRPALATGRLDVLTQAECGRVLLTPDGRKVEGVLLSHKGQQHRVLAETVVVAAGVQQSALLLRRSRTDHHREGLGNNTGQLGRRVGAHSTGTVFPLISLGPLGPRHTKTFGVNLWYDGIADWPYPLGMWQVSGQMPLWQLTGRLRQPLVRAMTERSLTVTHMTEALPDETTGWTFNGDEIGEHTRPRHQAKTYAKLRRMTIGVLQKAGYPVIPAPRGPDFWHITGGAVMGADEKASVTDGTGAVHGIGGLYVTDASVLPSAGAVNTALTIAAVALRTGDAILGRLGQNASKLAATAAG